MGDKLSHCCCARCDLINARFNQFYFVDEMLEPDEVQDAYGQVGTHASSVGSRRWAILEGNVGAGVVYSQQAQNFPLVWTNRQQWLPEYTEHPDPEELRALPLWSLTSGPRYYYRIVDGGSAQPGFYYWRSNGSFDASRIGPILSQIDWQEPDWTSHWRRHFQLFLADGSEYTAPVDRFPATLQPGEYLLSRKMLPRQWFSIDLFNWLYDAYLVAGASARASLMVGDEEVAWLDYSVEPDLPWWSADQRAVQHNSGGELRALTVATGKVPRLHWIFRDGHQALTAISTGRDTFFGFSQWRDSRFAEASNDAYTYAGQFHSRQRLIATAETPAADPPAARLKLTVSGGEPALLGRVLAYRNTSPRITVWPRENDEDRPGGKDRNLTCPDTRACATVYPFGHLDFRLHSLELPGMEDGELVTGIWANVGCTRRLQFANRVTWGPHGTMTVLESGGFGWEQHSNAPARALAPLRYGHHIEWSESVAGSTTPGDLIIAVAPYDDTHVLLNVHLRCRYSTARWGPTGVDPLEWEGEFVASQVFNLYRDLSTWLSPHPFLLHFPPHYGQVTDLNIEPAATAYGTASNESYPDDNPAYGWSVGSWWRGPFLADALGTLNLNWSLPVPKWEGDPPVMELRGDQTSQAAEGWPADAFHPGRYLRFPAEVNIASGINDGAGGNVTGTIELIDLENLVLTIGGPA